MQSMLVALILSLLIASPANALRLSAKGDTVAGVGAGRIALNNAALPVSPGGGAPNWLSDTKIVYGAVKDGREWAIVSYDLATHAATTVAAGGGNDVYAGGGVWARWLGDGRTGLTTSAGFTCLQCGLLEVGPDGVVYFTRNRQTGRGLVARRPNGIESQVIPETQPTPLSVRGTMGGAVWQGTNLRVGTWNVPVPVTITGPIFNPRAAKVRGEWWLVYGDGRRILAQPFSGPTGYVVANFGNVFSIDAVALGGTLRVAYSVTQGEQPGDVRVLDVDVNNAPRVSLSAPSAPPTLPAPPETAIPNHKAVVVAARAQFANVPAGPERGYLIVNAAAWMLRGEGAGLYFKPSGTNHNQRSIDIIMYRDGRTFDVLGDAEGSAKPQWTATEPTGRGDPKLWRAPSAPGTPSPPPPTPTPPPPPPPTPDSTLSARLSAVEAGLAELKVNHDQQLNVLQVDVNRLIQELERLTARVLILETKPPQKYRGSVLGIPVSIEAVQ